MNNTSKLVMALEELQQAELNELRYEISEHDFSKSFERKMKKVINSRNVFAQPTSIRPRYMLKYALIAIIAMVVLAACGSLVKHLFMGGVNYDDYATYALLHGTYVEDTPNFIKEKYDITYNLDEFTRTVNDDDEICRYITYKYQDSYIELVQSTINDYSAWLNTEDADVLEIEINGHKAILCTFSNGGCYVLWNNDDYILEINSNLDKNIVIGIAKSVEKL